MKKDSIDAKVDELGMALAKVIQADYAEKFSNVFDELEPDLVVELSEEAERIMTEHNISSDGYEGAIAEFALMWILYERNTREK